jgi:GAF domain-containing protein
MKTSAEYQKLASDCLDMAERASPDHKAKLHEMVELWLQLATDALERENSSERIARNGSHVEEFERALRVSQADLAAELEATQLLQAVATELIPDQGSIERLYHKLAEAAAAIMQSDFSSMQMFYPERGAGGELRLLASRGFDAETMKFWEWVRADSGCTCGEALRTRKRVIASDVETCAFMVGTPDREAYLQAGIRAVQSTPLTSRDGRLIGMLSTHWCKPHHPSERELRHFDILARQAADVVERARTTEALRESEARLRGEAAASAGSATVNGNAHLS